jgi:hypothetical protein
MMPKRWEGPPESLSVHFDPLTFLLVTTEELTDLDHIIGQERAVRAMEFEVQIRSQGYNLYVSGVCGTNKKVVVKAMIEQAAAQQLPQFPSHMRRTYFRLGICPFGWRRRSAVDVLPVLGEEIWHGRSLRYQSRSERAINGPLSAYNAASLLRSRDGGHCGL